MAEKFKHSGLPQSEAEMVAALEEIRSRVTDGDAKNEEAMAKVTADVKSLYEAKEVAERAAKAAENALEIAKAAQRDGRVSEDKVERQLKHLPLTYEIAKDEDWSNRRVSAGHFNIMQMGDAELRLALDDEAYQAAKRLRRLNDTLMTAHIVLSGQSHESARNYAERGGLKGLRLYGAYKEAAAPFARALDTATAGGVSEWAPTGYSSELMQDVRDKLAFGSMFSWTPMPQNPWQYPVLKGFMQSYLVGEATTDAQATTYTASDVVSAGALLTAKKHGVLTWLSREADADSIFAIIPELNNDAATAIAFGWDNMICNGQLTATIDTGSVPAASDVRKGANGFRYGATLTGKSVDFGGTSATVEALAALIGALGKYGADAFYATGYSGLARLLVLKDGSGSTVLLSMDRNGPNATMNTGNVGVLLGRPLVVSGVYPENMNATGIVDGTGTKTGIHCLNPKMYLGGLRQSVQIEVNDNPGWLADQRALKANARIAMQPVITPSATYKFVAAGVNLGAY